MSKTQDNTMLQVRCSRELREAFVESCKSQDTTAAQELRKFMRQYVAKNGQGSFKL